MMANISDRGLSKARTEEKSIEDKRKSTIVANQKKETKTLKEKYLKAVKAIFLLNTLVHTVCFYPQ